MYKLTEYGRQQIADFILCHHVQAFDILNDSSLFADWIAKAEEQFNSHVLYPEIIIPAYLSKSGDDVLLEILLPWMIYATPSRIELDAKLKSKRIQDW